MLNYLQIDQLIMMVTINSYQAFYIPTDPKEGILRCKWPP